MAHVDAPEDRVLSRNVEIRESQILGSWSRVGMEQTSTHTLLWDDEDRSRETGSPGGVVGPCGRPGGALEAVLHGGRTPRSEVTLALRGPHRRPDKGARQAEGTGVLSVQTVEPTA